MKASLYLVMVYLLTSCASTYKPATEKKVENEKVFAATFDKVWSKTVAFVSSNGMNVKTIDKASGLISFERAYDSSFNSKYMDCGQMVSPNKSTKQREEDTKNGIKDTSAFIDGTTSMNFFIEKASEKETKVKINIFGKAMLPAPTGLYGVPVGSPTSHPCYSNGAFEQEVFAHLAK